MALRTSVFDFSPLSLWERVGVRVFGASYQNSRNALTFSRSERGLIGGVAHICFDFSPLSLWERVGVRVISASHQNSRKHTSSMTALPMSHK